MPPPVADKSKVQKRKTEMGHGSFHGDKAKGYGKSPVVAKRKLAAAPGLVPARSTNLSPPRGGPTKRTESLQHPHSAPARVRKSVSLPMDGSAPIPDLVDLSGGTSPKISKTKPNKKRSAGDPPMLTPETSTKIFNASMPAGLIFSPILDLDFDSSDDEKDSKHSRNSPMLQPAVSSGSENGSMEMPAFHMSASMNSSMLLQSIPEKKKKKVQKSSPSSSSTSSPKVKHQKHPSVASEKSKVVVKHAPSLSPIPVSKKSLASSRSLSQSPGPHARTSVSANARSASQSPGRHYHKSVSDVGGRRPSKSPVRQYVKSVSDIGGAARPRTKNQLVASKNDSIMSLDGPHDCPRSPTNAQPKKHRSLPEVPSTWHSTRDSRKLNSSNIGHKIGGMAMVPPLDPGLDGGDRLSKSSRSKQVSLNGSSHVPKRQSSLPLQSQKALGMSQSSHARTSSLTLSNHQGGKQMSRSDHVKKDPIPRDSIMSTSIPRDSQRASKHSSGVVGSMLGMVDKVLERTVQVPSGKYGLSEREKSKSTQVDDDSDGDDSFANDDVEASGNKRVSFKNSNAGRRLKKQWAQKSTKALKFMETTLGIEKKPPKTLVIVWILIVAELAFDFVTTVISFGAFSQGMDCCGYEMNLGRVPMGITIPFFFLVLAETMFLFIAITLTLWPSILADAEDNEPKTGVSRLLKPFMCCLKWDSHYVLFALNVTVILNPFFG